MYYFLFSIFNTTNIVINIGFKFNIINKKLKTKTKT